MLALNVCILVLVEFGLVTAFNPSEPYCKRCSNMPQCYCVQDIKCSDHALYINVGFIDGHYEEIHACAIALPAENYKLLISKNNSRIHRKTDTAMTVTAIRNSGVAELQIITNITQSSILSDLITLFFNDTTCIKKVSLTAIEITSSILYKLCDDLRLRICIKNSQIEVKSTAAIILEYPSDIPKSRTFNLSTTDLEIFAPYVVIKTNAFDKWQLQWLIIHNLAQLEAASFAGSKITNSLKLHLIANWSEISLSNDSFIKIEQLTSVLFVCSSTPHDRY